MLFSVNAAIRGQIEMLEFDPIVAKEAMNSVTDIKSSLDKTNKKLKALKDTVIQISVNMSNQITPNIINRKNAPYFVKSITESQSKRMDSIQKECTTFSQKLKKFKTIFYKLLPIKQKNLPQFIKNASYNVSQSPRFPQYPQITSIIDYFEYFTKTIPYSQNVIKELHYYLCQLHNSLSHKANSNEFEQFRSETKNVFNSISSDIADYHSKKDSIILKDNFNELANQLQEIAYGESTSSATDHKCLACGKHVQRVSTGFKININNDEIEQEIRKRPLTARRTERSFINTSQVEQLNMDSIQKSPLTIRRTQTSRPIVKCKK